MRDAGTEPDVEMHAGDGRPPPAPPGVGQRVRPGYSTSSTFFDVPTEIVIPPPPPPPDGPRVTIYTGPTRRPPPAAPLVMTSGGQPPDPPAGGASGYVAEPARMDTDLPVIYRIHTPDPDPEYPSRLKPRKVPWRRGVPPVITDERRAFVANLERAAKAVEKQQRELEIGRRRLDSGRMVGSIINQQQGLGDVLTQIATPELVLHNAPRPDPTPITVTPPPPPQPPGGGGAPVRGRDPAPRPVTAASSSSAPAEAPTFAPSYPPARARPSAAPASPARPSAAPAAPSRAPARPSAAPAAPSRARARPSAAPIPQSSVEPERSRSGSSMRGADIVPPPTPGGRSIEPRDDARVTAKDSRELLGCSRSPRRDASATCRRTSRRSCAPRCCSSTLCNRSPRSRREARPLER